jgi:hypothetical protein
MVRKPILFTISVIYFKISTVHLFTMAQKTPPPRSGLRPPHYRVFLITLRHTTVGRTPLDEWSAQSKDIYLTTHNTHKRQTSMPPTEFEPTIPLKCYKLIGTVKNLNYRRRNCMSITFSASCRTRKCPLCCRGWATGKSLKKKLLLSAAIRITTAYTTFKCHINIHSSKQISQNILRQV